MTGIEDRLSDLHQRQTGTRRVDVSFSRSVAALALNAGINLREIGALIGLHHTRGVAIEAAESVLGGLRCADGVFGGCGSLELLAGRQARPAQRGVIGNPVLEVMTIHAPYRGVPNRPGAERP